jgi:hypothetical protein
MEGMMKSVLNKSLPLAILFCLACSILRAESGSWLLGSTGLKSGSVAPPGKYFVNFLYLYDADEFRDRNGDKLKSFNDIDINSVNLELQVESIGFNWVSPYKVFGANYGCSILGSVAHVKGDLSLGLEFGSRTKEIGASDSRFALSDTWVEPINLSWHLKRFDVFTSYSFFAPTGSYDSSDIANTGRDRWTHMFSGGMTAYLDEKKSWTVSISPRYEIHMGQQQKDLRAGDNLNVEWGIGKQFVFINKEIKAPTGILNVGPVGYAQWQITKDDGVDATAKSVKDRVFAAGVEATYTRIPWHFATFGLRFNKEFAAENRPQGVQGMFTFAIKF